ncbi:carbohydrate ABC transporter permease [uncultured Sphaerochaeta sp.]|uniref:carbohydrate ABC transporter permease n=1 Tax=uncultured Sphaerochaeta sp. TaxID=886478 RepID=UPI002A0A51A6|nr:carbohydrate ABC transporter permease [uncultured Sphaerochaeta sp.]
MKDKKRKKDPIWVHAVLILACTVICFPVVFAMVKATQDLNTVPTASMLPGNAFWGNLKVVWTDYHLGRYMRNSFFISLWVAGGKIVLSLFAALALVFYKFKGKKLVFPFILITLIMPTEVLILGLFNLVSNQRAPDLMHLMQWMFSPLEFFFAPTKYGFGWGDNLWGVITPFLASATGVFLFRQHFMSIPHALADSARIDGATSLQFLFRILIPMSLNTIGALALIQFVYVWDQYIWPRVILRKTANQVVQVGLNMIVSTGESVQWGQVMTAVIIAMIPPLLVFACLYRSFMKGYALSSDK